MEAAFSCAEEKRILLSLNDVIKFNLTLYQHAEVMLS